MPDSTPNPSSTCKCNLARGGDIREYQLPPGAIDTFALYHPLDGNYERLYRCTVCGQFWHQSVTGGHATIEIFNQVDEKVAAALVASEEAAAPIRAAARERSAADAREQIARDAARAKDSTLPVARIIAGLLIATATVLSYYSMTLGTGPSQMRLVTIGGGCFLLAFAVLALAAWYKSRSSG
jgi:hypothetical protein